MPQFNNLETLGSVRAKLNAAIAKTEGESPISLNPGTVASPGANFSGDTDTGIFNPAANTVGVVTGGTERLRVHPSGGVSVGSSSDPGNGNLRVAGITATAAVTAPSVSATGAVSANSLVLEGTGFTAAMLSNLFPVGGIIMWSGSIAAIPTGWRLCDGTNGTPDLRNRFVVGAGSSYAVGATGGADTVALSTEDLPAHSHTFSGTTSTNGDHDHALASGNVASGSVFGFGSKGAAVGGGDNLDNLGYYHTASVNGVDLMLNAGNHAHSFSGTTSWVGSGTAHENRPPYFALAYIMKV